MPHVMTLEGANFGNDPLVAPPVVSYPPAGSPLAPHSAIVGPTRVAPMVFGPGGTPTMYRRRYPARGPVCDYCDPDYFVMDGAQTVIPYKTSGFGGFMDRQDSFTATALTVGGSLAIGTALSLFGVWLYNRSGQKRDARGARW